MNEQSEKKGRWRSTCRRQRGRHGTVRTSCRCGRAWPHRPSPPFVLVWPAPPRTRENSHSLLHLTELHATIRFRATVGWILFPHQLAWRRAGTNGGAQFFWRFTWPRQVSTSKGPEAGTHLRLRLG